MNYNDFCDEKGCEHFIVWSYEKELCTSCKLVGESYNIDSYPDNCPYLDDIRKETTKEDANV